MWIVKIRRILLAWLGKTARSPLLIGALAAVNGVEYWESYYSIGS